MSEAEFNGLLAVQMENPNARVTLGANGEAIVDPNKEPLSDDVWASMAAEIASKRAAAQHKFGQDILPSLVSSEVA